MVIMIKHTMALSNLVAIMAVLGVAWPVLFGDASATAKLLIRNYEVAAAGDAEFEAAMGAELYGDSLPGTSVKPVSEQSTSNAYVTNLLQLDRGVASVCLLVTLVLAFTCNKWPRLCLLYLLPAFWLLVNAHAISLNGGKAFSELAIPAHATRFGLLFALAILFWQHPKNDRFVHWLIRISCGLTFAIHGWEALHLNPNFQDLLYFTAGHVNIDLTEWGCHGLLRIIGIMDILLAISVVSVSNRRVLIWMACWGLITAASRPIALGLDAWPEFAMRLPNAIMPLLLIFHRGQTDHKTCSKLKVGDQKTFAKL